MSFYNSSHNCMLHLITVPLCVFGLIVTTMFFKESLSSYLHSHLLGKIVYASTWTPTCTEILPTVLAHVSFVNTCASRKFYFSIFIIVSIALVLERVV